MPMYKMILSHHQHHIMTNILLLIITTTIIAHGHDSKMAMTSNQDVEKAEMGFSFISLFSGAPPVIPLMPLCSPFVPHDNSKGVATYSNTLPCCHL